MERTLDRIAGELGIDRAEIRRRNLIGPDEFPYDVGVTFQDGGPTVYDSGDYPRGLSARALRRMGDGSGSGSPATSRGPASARTRARP